MFKKAYRISKELAVGTYNLCLNRPYGYVMMLHRIGLPDPNRLECIESLKVSAAYLQRFIDIHRDRYDFVSLEEVEQRFLSPQQRTRPFIHFSFDDGFSDNLTIGLPFFEKNNIPFSVFITVDFVDKEQAFNYPFVLERIVYFNDSLNICGKEYRCETREQKNTVFRLLKELVLSLPYKGFEHSFRVIFSKYLREDYFENITLSWEGVQQLAASPLCTIGSHTMSHPRLSNVPLHELPYELRDSKWNIESKINEQVNYISYPFGWSTDYNDDVIKITQDAGYRMAFRSFGGAVRRQDREKYCVNRIMFSEYE